MTAPVLFSFSQSANYSTNSTTVYGGAMNCCVSAPECILAARGGGQGQFKSAGTLSNYNVYVFSTNTRTTDVTFGIELNGSSVLSVTYTSGQTGLKEDTSSVAIVADDLLNSYITTGASGGSITPSGMSLKFVPASGTVSNVFSSGVGTTLTGTGPITEYMSFGGRLTSNPPTTEANAQLYMQHAGTASYMQMQVVTNTRDTSTIVDLRINGATVNQTFTYTTTQTGKKVDASNTDAFVTGDLACIRLRDTGAGTGNLLITLAGIFTTSTVDGEFMVAAGVASGKASTANGRGPLGGRLAGYVTSTDANGYQVMAVPCVGSKLWAYCSVNTQTGDFVLATRNNGGAGNQTITVPASGNPTGVFQDTTHSDTFALNDLANYAITVAAAGNTLTMVSMKLVSDVIPVSSGRRNLALMGVG